MIGLKGKNNIYWSLIDIKEYNLKIWCSLLEIVIYKR